MAVFEQVKAFDQVKRLQPAAADVQPLGRFTLTAYSLSYHSTGKRPNAPGFGVTYSGTRATVDRTVAVDPHVIPIGTPLYIEGVGWRLAEDVGGLVKGRHIDILLESDRAAIQFGVRRNVPVYSLPAAASGSAGIREARARTAQTPPRTV
ncbi:MAG: 3D domain-containing protein [Alicyclobacillus sp.]|nr:3D domain-containing protein [Alicyclobacillus sp.]